MKKAALYVRLSQEDKNKINSNDNSESIENQILMLTNKCKSEGWEIYDIYNDDDWKGSDRTRPEFNRMIGDAEQHKFDIIMTKTQSRFCRDLELVERYINHSFPLWGIRFISIVDGADTDDRANRKSRQLHGLIDEWYLESMSENIRAVLSAKRNQGQWVGAFTPYGYVKSPTDKHKLVVDEDAAKVIRQIYDWYLDGMGVINIVRTLNNNKIPNPSSYKKEKGIPFERIHSNLYSEAWHYYSVQRILNNQVYCGDTVQGKAENISYKSNKKRQKPKSEWSIVENTHEPIIDKETFYRVQAIIKSKSHAYRGGNNENLFSRKLRCLKCGGSMRTFIAKHKRYYRCSSKYEYTSGCEGTYISYSVLYDYVFRKLKEKFDKYLNVNDVADKLEIEGDYEAKLKNYQNDLDREQFEIDRNNKRLQQCYIDKMDGIISLEQYLEIRDNLENKINKHKDRTIILNAQIAEYKNSYKDYSDRLAVAKKYCNIESLDRFTLDMLIDTIEIGGNKKNRIIQINWKW